MENPLKLSGLGFRAANQLQQPHPAFQPLHRRILPPLLYISIPTVQNFCQNTSILRDRTKLNGVGGWLAGELVCSVK